MRKLLTWFENWELEKAVYTMILKGVVVLAFFMAVLDYLFYSISLAFLEFIFAIASFVLLKLATSNRLRYAFSSRVFILFMAMPIYWNLLFNQSAIESTILFIFLPIITIILRPLKEVLFFGVIFGGSFIYISLSGMGLAEYTAMELFKLISMQTLIGFFVLIYVQMNKNYQKVVSAQSAELKNANVQLEELYKEKEIEASTDTLTGLSNRGAMRKRLEYLYARYNRQKEIFSIVLFDVDKFKAVNDTYGHQKGDEILIKMAKVTLKEIREVDMAIRYGGEEFVILLPQTNAVSAVAIAERIRLAMSENIKIEEKSVTASFGVVEVEEGLSVDKLINRADEALYEAKAAGRNRVICA